MPRPPKCLSLFAVDVDAVARAWKTRSLGALAAERPRGRLAGIVGALSLDASEPAARTMAHASGVDQHAVFEALVEDFAVAGVWDAPEDELRELFATLARLVKAPGLELGTIDEAPPAHAPETVGLGKRLVRWPPEPARLLAVDALARLHEFPPGAFSTSALFDDLAASLEALLAAKLPVLVARG